MVVLSAAVVTRNGKVLVARQFMAMSKLRIEGLLSAFPKLIVGGGEHTFIETENVRYIYQPIEQLYVLIITNKQSNIMEDLESLRLVARLIPDFCPGHDEAAVTANAFQLIFALDEVISVGYRENVTIQQVHTFCEMDSHEAKLQKIIKASQEDDARVKSRQMAKEIESRKQKLNAMGGGAQKGFSNRDYASSNNADYSSGNGYPPISSSSAPYQIKTEPSTREQRTQQGSVGLRLGSSANGSARQGDQFFAQLATEEHLMPTSSYQQSSFQSPVISHPREEVVQGVFVLVEELITVQCERDGSLSQLDAVGTMKLTIGNPDYAHIRLKVSNVANAPKGTRFQPHPKIDKPGWIQNQILALKDGDKGFPHWVWECCPHLKMEAVVYGTVVVPNSGYVLAFFLENGKTVVTLEYQAESQLILNNVQISFPCPSAPASHSDGNTMYHAPSRTLIWNVGDVEPESTGTMEWVLDAVDSDALCPINVSFSSSSSLAGVAIEQIVTGEASDSVEFTCRSTLQVQSFTLQ